MVKQLHLIQKACLFFICLFILEMEQGRCDISQPMYLSQLFTLPNFLLHLLEGFQAIEAVFCEMGTVT